MSAVFADLAYRIQHAGEFVPLQPIGKPIDDKAPPVLPPNFTAVAQIQMPTDTEMLLALAEEEKPCPGGYQPESYASSTTSAPPPLPDHRYCPQCGKTGRVPLYPTLREPCIGVLISAGKTHEEFCCLACGWLGGKYIHDENCESCSGHNSWVLIQHDVVATLIDLCYEVRFVGAVYVRLHQNSGDYSGYGEARLSRLLSAIVLATAEEYKP